MNWYYVDAGQQAGPVDEAQLEALARSGKVQADTLVWHEGVANWQAYAEVKPPAAQVTTELPPVIAALSGGGTSGGPVCSVCRKTFAPAEVIRYGDHWVCATCKPIFFQRVHEG